MHDTAFRIGGLVMTGYCHLATAKILEIGSYNVNGSLRDFSLPSTHYVGLDLDEGPGVDRIITPGQPLPVDDDSFDLVMASSVFEHDPAFWMTFIEMCRKAVPGGHIYISAPANGTVHRYPQDNWRFYPDAGLALMRWAGSQGQEVELVESFVADRQSDVWNDFVAIFRKGPSQAPMATNFVSSKVPCSNIRTWQSSVIQNRSDETEDMRLLTSLRENVATLETHLATRERQFEEARQQLLAETDEVASKAAALENELKDVRGELAARDPELSTRLKEREDRVRAAEEQLYEHQVRADAEKIKLAEIVSRMEEAESNLAEVKAALTEARNEVEESARERDELAAVRAALEEAAIGTAKELQNLRNEVSDLNNVLRQRREEIKQAWAEVESGQVEREELMAEIKRQSADNATFHLKLREAEEWVFKLAGDRQKAEASLKAYETVLSQEVQRGESAEARVLELVARLDQVRGDASVKVEQLDADRKHAHDRLQQARDQVATLVERLRDRENQLSAVEEKNRDLESRISAHREEVRSAVTKTALVESELQRGQREKAEIGRSLQERELAARQRDRHVDWLRRVHEALSKSSRGWRAFLPPAWRKRQEFEMLRNNGLFDAKAYLERYPDVVEAGMDPLRHYILHGMLEGREAEIKTD